MYDVCFDSHRGPGARVLLTLTGEAAAGRIASAIQAEAGELFQVEGIRAFVRKVDRGPKLVSDLPGGLTPGELHAMNAPEVQAIIRDQGTIEAVDAIADAEKVNPRFRPAGRTTIRDTAQERRGEIVEGVEE